MAIFHDIKNGLEEAIYLTQQQNNKTLPPEVLENSSQTKKYLDNLPRVYLVVRYFGIAILEFPFTGMFAEASEREKDHCNVIPLVYDYDDCNGTCDNYFLRKVTDTTTGWIADWRYTREAAEELKAEKEKEMIKIIKEGKKEFTTTCPICSCEFSYELEDLQQTLTYKIVKCPCCGKEIVHKEEGLAVPKSIGDDMIWETPEYKIAKEELKRLTKERDSVSSPCLTCDWHKQLMLGHTYVGDSPCQWCQYSGLKITCTSTGTTVNGVK